ncbi:MAG: c-type cytochrome [Bacteroidia bacterium]
MKNKISLTIIGVLSTLGVFAQGTEAANSGGLSQPLLWIIYLVLGLLLLVTYILYVVSRELKRYVKGESNSEEAKMWDSRSSWEKIFQLKPVGTDKDTMIDEPHDGIYELDNPPPPWFMFLFYGCIVFAVFYVGRFMFTDYGYTQEDEYIAEMKASEKKQSDNVDEEALQIDENSVVALTESAALSSGKKIYNQNCKVCHGDGGKGMMGSGPNLTDEYWKHGGGVQNVFKSIKYGIIEKGMMAWKDNLSPQKMQEVTSYILSLQGTNPEGAKEPEGEKWVPTDASEDAPAETETPAAE